SMCAILKTVIFPTLVSLLSQRLPYDFQFFFQKPDSLILMLDNAFYVIQFFRGQEFVFLHGQYTEFERMIPLDSQLCRPGLRHGNAAPRHAMGSLLLLWLHFLAGIAFFSGMEVLERIIQHRIQIVVFILHW
ncbi:MAG: hypothetical protein ACYC9O_15665, partial [Candidatus Latescibacterota bacterium]